MNIDDKKNTSKAEMKDAVVVFGDARGFTAWADKNDVFAFIDQFGRALQMLLSKTFKGWYIKHLGDGAMMIKEINEKTTERLLKTLLTDAAKCIHETDKEFNKLCKQLSVEHGSQVPLRLGWGITKGHIKNAGDDYIGSDINKSARLCSIARPFGIVVDRDDFPVLPSFGKNLALTFVPQARKLKGLHESVNVWVTKEIASQFVTREDLRETPEVHVAGLCFKKENGNVFALVSKRASNRSLFPNLYEGCGGQLSRNELFATGVARHYKLEMGIEVNVIEEVHEFYHIQYPDEPNIPGICFLCEYKGGDPKSENHSEVKWVSEQELSNILPEKFISGLKDRFVRFFSVFEKRKKKSK